MLSACTQAQNNSEKMDTSNHTYTNHLIHESSPYLLQHAHNPVDWYPWGEEALGKAKKENKLIIISIGYSACHWCHVMEHESFEDTAVAKYMNENFVCIKVDREERPDIDQVYMNAVQLLTGRGGWPLNCIALPDGRPIYGGTYYPKAQWLDMLAQVKEYTIKNPKETEEQATLLTEGIRSGEMIYASTQQADFSEKDLDQIFKKWKNNIDYIEGGSAGAPKFALPIGYQYLLHYYYLSQDADALKAVTVTLNKMADGGIYDQIGGGFARYSVDAYWKVPHFEKMLYDNAQLISLYSAAYLQTGDEYYKRIAEESLEFIKREMTSPEGGFYSALDADSEGEEGKYYVWSQEEIKNVLGKNAALILEYYNVMESGNWENGINILYKTQSDAAIAKKYNISEKELLQQVDDAKEQLLSAREKRIRPGLDDKILTAWNGLMLKAYVDAYRAFGEKEYLDMALKSATFINTKMKMQDNRLNRNYKNGKSSINGFLDDYAFSASAFTALYQATFDAQWLNEALQITDYALQHFFDTKSGMLFYTSDIDPELIARKMEITDNVIPAASSEFAKNMFILGNYFDRNDLIEKSIAMAMAVKKDALKSGPYYANWDILFAWLTHEPYEVAILGNDYEKMRSELDTHYLPNIFLMGGKQEGDLQLLENKLVPGQTTIYVCQNKVCQLPVTNVEDALKQIVR
ncbi:MAG: thioredoxin domain-containing protein [Chitinophagales bacterium]|nr:thioredoxin domain-containing protein [Chitinophagales bacterium]